MIRICQTATEEIGGLLLFSKEVVEGYNVLRLNRAEFVAGTTTGVAPTNWFANHENDPQWILFHSHPHTPSYAGLSGTDLFLLFQCTILKERPISHILLAERFIHYTFPVPQTFERVRQCFVAYKEHRVGIETSQVYDEILEGMQEMFSLAERYIRTVGNERDETSMNVLDALQCLPDDPVTAHMFAVSPPPTTIFLQWFATQVPETLRTPDGSVAQQRVTALLADRTNPNAFGLFYSWSVPTSVFLREGVLQLADGGEVYRKFEEVVIPPPPVDTTVYTRLFATQPANMTGGAVVNSTPSDLATLDKISHALTEKKIPHFQPPPQIASSRKRRTRRAKRHSRRR